MTLAGKILNRIHEDAQYFQDNNDIWATVSQDAKLVGAADMDNDVGITTTRTAGLGHSARGPMLNPVGKDIWDLQFAPDDPEDVGQETTFNNDAHRPMGGTGDSGQAITANVGVAHAGGVRGVGMPPTAESYYNEDDDKDDDDDDSDDDDGDGDGDGDDGDDDDSDRSESYRLGVRIGESDEGMFADETVQEFPCVGSDQPAVVNVSDSNVLSVTCNDNTYILSQPFPDNDAANAWFASNVQVPISGQQLQAAGFTLVQSAGPTPVQPAVSTT